MSNNQPNITIKNQFTRNIENNSSILSIKTTSDGISEKYHFKNDEKSINTPPSATKQIIIHEIVNNYSQNGRPTHHSTNNNNNSITILTSTNNTIQTSNLTASTINPVVLDRINICINNHFSDSTSHSTNTNNLADDKSNIMKVDKEDTEPDSTTNLNSSNSKESRHSKFQIAEDVLVEHKDGKFYLGTIVAVAQSQCLVKYDDNTERWSSFDELTKLSSSEADSAPLCVACKITNSTDTVEVCEKCGRGYHSACNDGNYEKNHWYCKRCTAQNVQKLKQKDIRYVCSGVLSESMEPLHNKSQLPYDIQALTWDSNHRVNMEQIYCYCGKNGEWYKEMIQCSRCQQWYHGKCIRSLQYPIFYGDRFYIFLCSICNHGHEFVRRLELKWPDLVHLLLFNLTMHNTRKYYDAVKAIVPYAEDNWKILQLPDQIAKTSQASRKDNIYSSLGSDKNRFKCGSEIKKRSGIWGLRSRTPPLPPNIKLPPGPVITEHILTQMCKDNPEYKFLPRVALEKSFVNDVKSREKMKGNEYGNPLISEDESIVSDETNNDNAYGFDDDIPIDDDAKSNDIAILNTGKNLNLNDSLFSSNAIDGFPQIKSEGCNSNRRAFQARSKVKNGSESYDIYDSSDDTSRNTLDLIIPKPKDFQGTNNPFHNQNIQQQNSKATVKSKRSSTSCTSNNSQISSNLPNGDGRTGRIAKRRLSGKDIVNGPKQDAKRKKVKRDTSIGVNQANSKAPGMFSIPMEWSNTLNGAPNVQSSSSNSTPAASPPNGKKNPGHGRRLRQRQEKNYAETPRRSVGSIAQTDEPSTSLCISLPGSPMKNGDQKDLQTSLNMYFGTANRILSGEKFVVKGKRLATNGKLQYLVEWEGCSAPI